MLEAAKIKFRIAEYDVDESDLSGVHVAEQLGQAPEQVFKTLVLKGERTGYLVFCVPVDKELDLKKAAKAAKDKKVEMLPMKDLLSVTGYIRGGCSPIGMKKKYPTYIDETAILYEEVAVSAGTRGAQIIIEPNILCEYVDAEFTELTV